MSSTNPANPRRRSLKTTLPALPSQCSSSSTIDPSCRQHNMSLRKGATFHSPTTPPSENFDPILSIPRLPQRSPTCPRAALEHHVAIAAGEKRMADQIADLLGSFERLPVPSTESTDSQATVRGEDLPVPRGILEANIITEPAAVDLRDSYSPYSHAVLESPLTEGHHRHASDSGLGSSVSDSMMSSPEMGRNKAGVASRQRSAYPSTGVLGNVSAVTRSISSTSGLDNSSQALSLQAFRQIERHVIAPLLRAKQLKAFHPLVQRVPTLISNKEITCLRDLEKTLLFLAPVSQLLRQGAGESAYCLSRRLKRFAISKALYLRFCETSIQCVHTAVEYLNERDQRRPTDRPYTNGYFLDLVEQIRQYAAMMAASRAREAAGEDANEWDYSPDETVALEGGMGQNGRPAEIVRRKNGKALSLRTNAEYIEDSAPTMKRSLSEDSSDDSALRSMARRKKNAPIKDITKSCDVCQKTFTRPCDLTKHEKTHSRPWKCPHATCNYHTKGWPTQKEMERHVNDKHDPNPPMYKCHYPNCPYVAKRESNCKQHMEKAHGYVYVRSKQNGKSGRQTSGEMSAQPTPQTPNLQTPVSSVMDYRTPASGSTGASASPYDQQTFQGYQTPYSGGPSNSVTGSGDFALYPEDTEQYSTPAMANDEEGVRGLDDYNFDFNDFSAFEAELQNTDPGTYTAVNSNGEYAFGSSPFTGHDTASNFDWNMGGGADYTAFNAQLATPASSAAHYSFQTHSRNPSLSMVSPLGPQQIPNLSPHGHGNIMLNGSDAVHMPADEGFAEFASNVRGSSSDFPLFDASQSAGNGTASLSSLATRNDQMFPPLTNQYLNDELWGSQTNMMLGDDFMNVDAMGNPQ